MRFDATLGIRFRRRRDEAHEALGEGQGEFVDRILRRAGLVPRRD